MVLRCVVLAALLLAAAAFVAVLYMTKMLAGRYLIVIGALLLAIFAIMAVLLLAFARRRFSWIGILVALVLAVGLSYGSAAGMRGIQTLETITSPTFTMSHVAVYVRSDDTAQSLNDISTYTFGTIGGVDREYVDEVIGQIDAVLPEPLKTLEFPSTVQLVDALMNGSIGGAIMDASYVDSLGEIAGYEDAAARIREITDLRVSVPAATPEPALPVENKHVYTVFISGIDSRKGFVRSSLSDVNIIATVNLQTRQVLLITTPRDYFVPFAQMGITDKLTHAGWYGIEVLTQTIADLYGLDIDYYFRVNFDGFRSLVDAIGGITVVSDQAFTVHGYEYVEGENYLDGEHALAYVRERKAFPEGDQKRGEHQAQVIRAVANKVLLSPELLTRYSDLLEAAEGNFETTVPYDLIASAVRDQLENGGSWDIVSYGVDGTAGTNVSPVINQEVYVLMPDYETVETAKDLMARVRSDEFVTIPTQTPDQAAAEENAGQ